MTITERIQNSNVTAFTIRQPLFGDTTIAPTDGWERKTGQGYNSNTALTPEAQADFGAAVRFIATKMFLIESYVEVDGTAVNTYATTAMNQLALEWAEAIGADDITGFTSAMTPDEVWENLKDQCSALFGPRCDFDRAWAEHVS